MVRSVTPIISAASHHFRLPAIALKITCCTFIIRSISAAGTCWFIPPALPAAFSKRTDHVLIRPDKSHATNIGVVPNYRTSPSLIEYKPLTPGAKLAIATQDSFDRGTVVLAAAFAGQAQLTNSNRSFGQGAAGY